MRSFNKLAGCLGSLKSLFLCLELEGKRVQAFAPAIPLVCVYVPSLLSLVLQPMRFFQALCSNSGTCFVPRGRV